MMSIERIIASLKQVLASYLLFGGLPVTLVYLLIRHRHSLTWKRLLGILAGYLTFTNLYAKRYPLGIPRDHVNRSPLGHLVRPLYYKVNKGRFIDHATSKLDESRTHLFVMVPHGLIPFGWLVAVGEATTCSPITLSASLIYKIPGLREVYLTSNLEGTHENFARIVKAGRHAGVIPGGVAEMVLTEPGDHVQVVCRHKGFIKLALKFAVPLVPIFGFGENNQFHQRRPPMCISNAIAHVTGGYYPFLPFGSFGPLLPHPTPAVHVKGDAIDLPRIEQPSQEEIDLYHEMFYENLSKLIQETKHQAGFPNIFVEFIGLEKFNVTPDSNHTNVVVDVHDDQILENRISIAHVISSKL